jgi:hypothetical protein
MVIGAELVAQEIVGGVDRRHELTAGLARAVGVQALRERPVRALDVLGRGVGLDAEDGVWVHLHIVASSARGAVPIHGE